MYGEGITGSTICWIMLEIGVMSLAGVLLLLLLSPIDGESRGS